MRPRCLALPCLVCFAAAITGPLAASDAASPALLFIRDGNVQVSDATSTPPRALTTSGHVGRAQWCAGGQLVAAFVVNDEGHVARVNLVTPDGAFQGKISGEVAQIADRAAGQAVALVEHPGERWQAVSVPAGRPLTRLISGAAPSLSPDGHTIVYHRRAFAAAGALPSAVLWMTDLATPGQAHRFSPALGKAIYDGSASYAQYLDQATELLGWSTGGDRLIVYRYSCGNGDWGASGLHVTPVARWAPTPLAGLQCCCCDFQWRPRPDSAQIAATNWGRHGPTWAVLLEGERLWSLPDLNAESGWDGSPRNSRSLGWSPGGRYVLTLAEDDGWVAVTDMDARQEVRRIQGATEATIDAAEQTVAYVKDGQVYLQSLAAPGSEGTPLGAGQGVVWRP